MTRRRWNPGAAEFVVLHRDRVLAEQTREARKLIYPAREGDAEALARLLELAETVIPLDAEIPPQRPVRRMASKYAGRCEHCRIDYAEGDAIAWCPGVGAVHLECLPRWGEVQS